MSADRVIRRAGAADLLDLRWQVLRAGRPRHTAALPGDDDLTTRHWAVWQDDRVVACATVMPAPFPTGPGPAWRLRGMAVEATLQGQGVGGSLLEAVQAGIREPMWCDARLAAVPFYQAHGWRVVSEVYDVPEVGPHHRMTWAAP